MSDADQTPPRAPVGDDLAVELKALRERVRALEHHAGAIDDATALLSMLSHELRSPVHALGLGIDVTLQRLHTPGDTVPREWLVERLETQRRAARRLKTLIDTFLEVAQLSAGRLPLDLGPVDLREVADDAVRAAADELDWAGARCRLDAPAPVVGRWDRLQLDIVVANLLSNAIKYGGGAPIDVTVARAADQGVLRLHDRGPGIAAEHQARIFEKFARVDTSSRVSGVGLGLWMVRQIAEALAGTVQVASAPGEGATFTVSLPLAGPRSP